MTENVGTRIWRLLEELGKRAWVPILLVGLISLLFTVLNYYSQRAANRPELAVATANMYWNHNPVDARFNFANTGRKTARRGTATLYAFTDNSGVKLGAAPIIGSGPNVMPGFGGNADMKLSVTDQPRQFLLCAVYFDETISSWAIVLAPARRRSELYN